MSVDLKESHWHKSDLARWNELIAHIPKVIESDLKLWQLRIDRQKARIETPIPNDHKALFMIDASRYSKREDGAYAPNGEHFSFLVCADNSRKATEKVKAELSAHGFNADEWSMTTNSSPLILA